LRRSHSWLKIAILFSFSPLFFLSWLSFSRTRLLSSSFYPQSSLNSFCSFPICPAERRRFSWAVRTSSPRELFSEISFWIRCLYVSDYWLLLLILLRYSLSSAFSLFIWLAERRRFSWAFLTSPSRLEFSLRRLLIFCFNALFSCSLAEILLL
jgi:hypothetical protein